MSSPPITGQLIAGDSIYTTLQLETKAHILKAVTTQRNIEHAMKDYDTEIDWVPDDATNIILRYKPFSSGNSCDGSWSKMAGCVLAYTVRTHISFASLKIPEYITTENT